MAVKILKTGTYAFFPPYEPQVAFSEGQIVNDLPEDKEKQLIADNWAESVDGQIKVDAPKELHEQPKELTEEVVDIADFLTDLALSFEFESEQKTALQDWGEVNLGEKVSRTKSVENMILELTRIKESKIEE